MSSRAAIIVLLTTAVLDLARATVPAQQGGSRDDRKAIVGVWKGGMPGESSGTIELTITPARITGRNPRTGESLGVGTYELDPLHKTIDSHRVEKFGRGKTYFGLYSLEGNTLKWVSNSRGNKRPADLVHRPDRDQFLMVLERER